MKKIAKLFDKLNGWFEESNRWKHALGCLVLTLLVFVVMCWTGAGNIPASVSALLACAAAGVVAEFKDSQWGGKFDWLDMLANLAGLVLGLLICNTIYLCDQLLYWIMGMA